MNRVLVVEDEEMIRKGIVLTVDWKALDCEVAGEAANGEEGLAAAERLKPDIIITDLKMPKMDGIAMLTELRKRGCTSKVIILTAYNSFSYARSALRLGAVDFLLKPYHDGELEEAILRLRELYPEDDAEEAAGEAAAGSGTADPGASETAVGTVSGSAGEAGAGGTGKAENALPVPELWDGQGSRYVRQAVAYIREHYSCAPGCGLHPGALQRSGHLCLGDRRGSRDQRRPSEPRLQEGDRRDPAVLADEVPDSGSHPAPERQQHEGLRDRGSSGIP